MCATWKPRVVQVQSCVERTSEFVGKKIKDAIEDFGTLDFLAIIYHCPSPELQSERLVRPQSLELSAAARAKTMMHSSGLTECGDLLVWHEPP